MAMLQVTIIVLLQNQGYPNHGCLYFLLSISVVQKFCCINLLLMQGI